MRKVRNIFIITIFVALLTAAGCSKNMEASQTPEQLATIQRGDISVDVTASGNLEFSHKEDLAFETAGTVKDVLVKAGDNVKAGQELARLDTTDWENQITTLTRAVTTAERNIIQAESNVQSANITLQNHLNTYTWPDIEDAQKEYDDARAYVDYAKTNMEGATTSERVDFWTRTLAYANDRLAAAQYKLDAINSLADTTQVALDRKNLELMQGKLDDARTALEDARKNLADAKAASPIVKAPFDGYITKVNYSGGEEIRKGAVAVTIVDPTRYQATILISERDILSVKTETAAIVQIEAMPTVFLPAKVTTISPTATTSSGVVSYQVEIELQSLVPLALSQSGKPQLTSETQVQTTGTPVELKEGLSVTVTLPIQTQTNVVLVPNRAISSQGQNTVVTVVKNGAKETRTIQTGISNIQYTEVTSGLTEGEEVLIKANTSTTSSQSSGSRQVIPGGMLR